ncbi:MAG: metallophosphoesterase [Tannerella sp.]|jgi:predicted MPP superfamily phosphohydrolase|nr:metallophosphoesterase [Tannerella sp.]
MRGYFLMLLLSYLGGNVYIFVRGLQTIRHLPPSVKWIAIAVYWLSVVSLVAVFTLRNSKVASTSAWHYFYEYSASWLVFTLYMAVFLLLCDGYKLIFNHSFHYGFIVALALTACLLVYGHYRYQHPVNRLINIDINKPATDGTTSLKIVAVSDIHLGFGTNKKRLQKYIRLINSQKPDIILIAGDLIDNSIEPVKAAKMEEELLQLESKYGVFMAPGNHEYISGLSDAREFITGKTNIRFLQDEVAQLPDGVQIVGRDDHSNRNRKSLSELMSKLDRSKPIIVIDHQPYELKEAENEQVDLLFCGHTHNGQVFPMSLMTARMFDLSYGYTKRGNTAIYVSSGLSLWGPPYRIGTDSELIVFDVHFQ